MLRSNDPSQLQRDPQSYGSVLVYENQLIEFVSALPEDYDLYGLEDHVQQLRLLNSLNLTIWPADIDDPIDR